jgi:hypothetical protein
VWVGVGVGVWVWVWVDVCAFMHTHAHVSAVFSMASALCLLASGHLQLCSCSCCLACLVLSAALHASGAHASDRPAFLPAQGSLSHVLSDESACLLRAASPPSPAHSSCCLVLLSCLPRAPSSVTAMPRTQLTHLHAVRGYSCLAQGSFTQYLALLSCLGLHLLLQLQDLISPALSFTWLPPPPRSSIYTAVLPRVPTSPAITRPRTQVSITCYSALLSYLGLIQLHTAWHCCLAQGSIFSCNRKAKNPADRVKYVLSGHHGPLCGLRRNPFSSKYFLSVGDWTARVWTDDAAVKTPILITKYHPTYLTGGECCAAYLDEVQSRR